MSAEECLVCGAPLEYLEQPEQMTCHFCGKQEWSHARCVQGHYICDACHEKIGLRVIRKACLETKSRSIAPFPAGDPLATHPYAWTGAPCAGRRSAAGSVCTTPAASWTWSRRWRRWSAGARKCLAAFAACGAPAGLVSAHTGYFPQHCHKSDAAFGPELGLEQPVDRQEPCSHRCNRRPPVLQKRFVYRTVAGGGVHSSTRIGANGAPTADTVRRFRAK